MNESIFKRRSVRHYLNQPLTQEDHLWVTKTLKTHEDMKGPWGHQFTFFLFSNYDGKPDEARQIGTYGFIKNAPAFFGAPVLNDPFAIIDYGYVLEHLILAMTAHDLGTVWLGGTFQRYKLDNLIKPGEIITAISAVGYPAEKMTIREKFTRMGIGADQRKPFNDLFSQDLWGQPLEENHRFQEVLELVRLGPSGTNQQPWRILVQENLIHLYLKPTPNYAKNFPFEMQLLDMGIALCHLEIGLNEKGMSFTYENNIPPSIPESRYIVSLHVH